MSPLAAGLRATRLFYSQALAVELIYRFSLLQGLAGVAVNCVGLVLFWLAAGKDGGAYSRSALLLYFLYASAHTIVQESRVSWNLSSGIRLGKLAASLLRPFPFLVSVVCQAAAFATVRVVMLAAVLAAVLAGSESLRVVAAAVPTAALGAYLGAFVLSLAVGWVTRIGIGLLAFDMTQTWGPELIFLSLYVAASGVSYPPDLLPPVLLSIVAWTPVYYMVGFPSLVLLGRLGDDVLTTQLMQGLVVLALTTLLVFALWRRGMRRFEAVGL